MMARRIIDRIAALEVAMAPKPDRWAEWRRSHFPVPMTLEWLAEPRSYIAKCRAEHVAQGHVITDDARPNFFFRDTADLRAVAIEQQRRLVAEGQADMDRVAEREAERLAAKLAAEAKPKRQPKGPPAFVRHPAPFAHTNA